MVNTIRYISGICAFISASSLALAEGMQEPQIVKLGFTWLSIMLFVIMLVFIIWALLRFKRKGLQIKKTQD